MPFAQINCFNHTDPTNATTSVKDLPSLNNQFWNTGKKDRIIATSPTKGKNLRPTSTNTHYGRSELREYDPKTGKKTAVKISQYGINIIAVRQAIFDLGPDKKSIGLQWHGDSTRPLVKGQWYEDKDGTYYLNVQVAKTYKAKEYEFVLVKGVKKGQIFDLAFAFNKDTFIAAYNWKGSDAKVETVKINEDGSYSKDTGLYAKAGVYCQTDITVAYDKQKDGAGVIALLEVYVYHGDKIDINTIDLDKTAYWRVGEILDLNAPERKALPEKTSSTKPTETPAETKPVDTKPSTPATPTPSTEDSTPTQAAPVPDTGGVPVLSPIGQIPAEPADDTPDTDDDEDDLLDDVPEKSLAAITKLVGQITTNVDNGAKKTAKENLSKLEDLLDALDDSEGVKLRGWCNTQRKAVA